jgi:hypothetical protein
MSRRYILWLTLILIWLLIGLSIAGAFVGVERAQALFNSVPAAVLWMTLAAALVAGIALLSALRARFGLLMSHLGCILILAGAIWGSPAGHDLQARLWGNQRVRRAEMEIAQGAAEDHVRLENGQMASLPFSLRLDEFRIDYYLPGSLQVLTQDGRSLKVPAEPGQVRDLGAGLGSLKVVRTFEHFRITRDPNGMTAYDDPNGDSNPATEVQIAQPDGTTQRQFVFERFPQPHPAGGGLGLSYRRMIKDYISRVEVIVHGQAVAAKAIEVNKPLHYGGYHFYQSSYGTDSETGKPVTVLTVVCDCGLASVYMGYAALLFGMAWQLWPRAWRSATGRQEEEVRWRSS